MAIVSPESQYCSKTVSCGTVPGAIFSTTRNFANIASIEQVDSTTIPSPTTPEAIMDCHPPFQYLSHCSSEQPSQSQLRETRMNIISSTIYSDLQDGSPSLQTLCYSLSNLTHPIKLVRPEDIFLKGGFPRYDECDNFTVLDDSSFSRCIAISHRWTNETNSLNHLDVRWLRENWNRVSMDVSEPLLFYDFTSLPQKKTAEIKREKEEWITFKAGLELIDHLFSHRAIVVPTKGYLFRYWCFVEFFVAAYNDSLLIDVPFVDPLAQDLRTLDKIVHVTHKAIIKSKLEPVEELEMILMVKESAGLLSLGPKTTSDIVGCLAGLQELKRNGKLGTMKVFLRELIVMRGTVANMVRARVRQCSLTVQDDQAYLDTILSQYIDRPMPHTGEMELEAKFEDWDAAAAASGLTDTIGSLCDKVANRKRKAS